MEKTITKEKPKHPMGRSLFLMFRWIGKQWPLLILAFGFLYAIQYLRTLVPLFGQHIIDAILKGDPSKLPPFLLNLVQGGTVKQSLLMAALMMVALEFIRSTAIIARRALSAIFAERIAYNLRNNLYRQLQNLDFGFHAHAETGDIIQRATTDIEAYRHFIGDQIIEVMRLIFLIGITIWQMSKLNTNLTLISLIIAPIIFTVAALYFGKIKKMFTVVEENEAKMTTHVQENVSGARVVKAFANEAYEVNKFKGLNRSFTDSDFLLTKKMAVFWSMTDMICFVQFCLTAVFGIIYTTDGTITLGIYTAFLAYSGNIIWPMRQLGRIIGDFSKATVSVGRLDDVLCKSDEYVQEKGILKPEITGSVRFDNVSFRFADSTYHQLEGISFAINKGETVAIIGKTGSGKSTLMNLLVRLLDYQEGTIYIDDYPITEIEKHYLRQNVGIILQEPFLFSKTVEENIGIADRNQRGGPRVQEVAKIARVHDDIVQFEKGYQTLVGERGVTLSGGQKQRVAIARMLLKPKPILIFDDSLSAVDTETDIQIREALKKEWKNSTVFIITHRITTAKEADRILVLDQGKIVETGRHQDLIKTKGLYRKIWDIQSKIDFQLEGGDDHE
ncbi:MAG: ABC transporter ATP-binding protein [Candidatus Izemoplasmatales bacterium]|jgi:ATP-binding cassette subfamily B protein|nr:ABC transporter ATP-binding protein [Candidatus Izemoplasmatales bacterium]MDD4987736.1 ABC transporter ATP-binding protein [Candidatus Izemoplasmatales bacterium]MDD5601647.1 ABC transporter ATP-binding protein [Candidatus Izemoplasmatales bacterium]MDY0372620.1 ABC transporter ATP-binding protein [Candidatus Izemoplasmatales bacterium]NLF48542.1 ABC transporter ATP-binding protein [Acholeplasmataceae bacterium]